MGERVREEEEGGTETDRRKEREREGEREGGRLRLQCDIPWVTVGEAM